MNGKQKLFRVSISTETKQEIVMEKLNSRRDFLKKASLLACFSQLTMMGWSTGFSTMLRESVNPSGEFSLLKLEKLLSGYKFPFIDNFSTDSFGLVYKLYNTYGANSIYAGELSLNAVSDGKDQQFKFAISRLANNGIKSQKLMYKYIVAGNVFCQNNATLSPQKWDISSKISLSNNGNDLESTGLTYKGEIKNEMIYLKEGRKIIKKTIGSMPVSWKWGLLAVVQKMAKESLQELQFSMLDEFDAIYKNQKLKYRKIVSLDCGNNRLIDFKVFELTGDGIIPTVYWVDNMNRCIFVISGMETYVLGV